MACGNDEQKIFLGEIDYQAFNSRATRTFYENRKICEIVLDDPKLQGLEDEDFFDGEFDGEFSVERLSDSSRKLVMLDSAVKLGDLAASAGNRLEKFSGNRAG